MFGPVGDHEATEAVEPIIYGYLHVPDAEPDEETLRTERELRLFAERDGFRLAAIFHEHDWGSRTAFHELVEALRRTGARHVVVLSLAHLSPHPLLRDSLLAHLELHASTQVVTVTSLADLGTV